MSVPSEPTSNSASASPESASTAPEGVALPAVTTSKSPEQIVATLATAAKRGRLPGFSPDTKTAGSGALFVAEAYAVPFTGQLVAHAESIGGTTKLTFTVRLRRKMPWVWLVVLLLCIWPGVWVTESQIAAISDSWWPWTRYWYLPLTIISVPLVMMPGLSRSRAMMRVSAAEVITLIGSELEGSATPGTSV